MWGKIRATLWVYTVAVFHEARVDKDGQARTKCGRIYQPGDPQVYTPARLARIQGRFRRRPFCQSCREKRWPEAVRKKGE